MIGGHIKTKNHSAIRAGIIYASILFVSMIYRHQHTGAQPISIYEMPYDIVVYFILGFMVSLALVSLLSILVFVFSVLFRNLKNIFRYFLRYPKEENYDALWIFFFLSIVSYNFFSLLFGFFSIYISGRLITVNAFDSIGMGFASALLMWFISPVILSYILNFLNSKELDKT